MPDPRDQAGQAARDAFAPIGRDIRATLVALGITPSLAAPDDPSAVDATTLATIEVTEPDGSTTRIPNITAFSYNADVQQVGDPFAVTVPDPRLELVSKGRLAEGSRVIFSLSSPSVAGGRATKKRTGRIIRREVSVTEGGGTVIQIAGADIGWHLANCDGPLWFGLQCTFDQLTLAMIHPDRVFPGAPDPGWGFADEVLYSNVRNTLNKQALPQGKAGIVLANQAQVTTPLMRIQIEPGEKLYDVLSSYCKRLLIFCNVTAEGELVIFLPSYDRPPDYTFRCYPETDSRHTQNNVLAQGIRRMDDVTERWSDVTCVGEIPLPDLADPSVAQDDVNANKFYKVAGDVGTDVEVAGSGLRTAPFAHHCVFADGEALTREMSAQRATWRQRMGLFNSHVLTFTVRGHHQGGIWFESDTMCSIDFPVVGIGPKDYYISGVRCDRDENGDRTQITAHLPHLLGVIGVGSF